MALFEQRLRQAIQLRERHAGRGTDACRLVFSEADQLPGLIIDRYGDLILFEINTKALDQDDIRALIVQVLQAELAPVTIVERSDARIRELEQLSQPPEAPLYSAEPVPQLRTIFHLNGLAFHYDANAGQKTGSLSRPAAQLCGGARYAHGDALDVCTYQGGFALHLAQACTRVTGHRRLPARRWR